MALQHADANDSTVAEFDEGCTNTVDAVDEFEFEGCTNDTTTTVVAVYASAAA